ncbi:MAG: helix-turn-helix domain-containing protein [Clostridiales bacterium]|nr:helix-turn-helix domain-containing protein [Clostridiales bacterium]
MSKIKKCNINDLFSLFEETLSPGDILSAKLQAQVSTAITKERKKLGMTQAQFARHINVTQSLISRWECGNYNFSVDKIADIASRLDLDADITFVPMAARRSLTECRQKTVSSSPQPTTLIYSPSLAINRGTTYTGKSFDKYLSNAEEDKQYVTVC